eukprot:jgi/Ulvmu1/8299/UM042_0004.1
MIAALACVPRGAAKARPVKDAPSQLEVEQLKEQAIATGAFEEAVNASGDDGDDEEADADAAGQDDGGDGPTVEAAVQHARAVAASMSSQRDKPSSGPVSVEDAFRQLDMDNYDNEPDDLVGRLLQVRAPSSSTMAKIRT